MLRFRSFLLSLVPVFFLSSFVFAGANDPWGNDAKIQVGVVVNAGNSVSAWTEASRNDISGGATSWITASNKLTALGDGTYQIRYDLVPGAVYNYLFAAHMIQTIGGLSAGSAYPEPCPNNGSDNGTYISTSSSTVSQPATGSIGYSSVGGDGRRLLTMPTDIAQGTTIYLFHNFASTPTGVANYSTSIGANYVDLAWAGGLGHWGSGAPAADTLGGGYRILVCTSVPTGTFGLLADLAGSATTYRHTGLTPGTSYYYVIASSDSYNGTTNPAVKSLWANLRRPSNTWAESQYVSNDKTALPSNPIPVYFKVDAIDEEHSKTGALVYLTPADVDGRLWPYKIQGTMIVVYIQ